MASPETQKYDETENKNLEAKKNKESEVKDKTSITEGIDTKNNESNNFMKSTPAEQKKSEEDLNKLQNLVSNNEGSLSEKEQREKIEEFLGKEGTTKSLIKGVSNDINNKLITVNDEQTKKEINEKLAEVNKMSSLGELTIEQANELLKIKNEINSLQGVESAENSQGTKEYNEIQKNQEKNYTDLLRNFTDKLKALTQGANANIKSQEQNDNNNELAKLESEFEKVFDTPSEKQKNSNDKKA